MISTEVGFIVGPSCCDFFSLVIVGGSKRVTLMVAFGFLPQIFGKLVGTYE